MKDEMLGEVNVNDVEDLLVTAFEGGINYWCGGIEIIECGERGTRPSEAVANGGMIRLFDAESDDSWDLDRDSLMKGILTYCKTNDVSFDDMIENHDADVADSIVQYALFDELVFG